ncbi:hypothetical protein HUT16_36715 [Kitasatospora sp. NA04385]|uniref:hypothetical protein n=1 Tax=Kitasatospora sp. NA04385 TaxID=2742135 RepID=UPI001591E68F|nr:hypothetical protein [Kitasatospora sp. NA04385]QKW23913.1 hypothetical protein HUT16_36715 [Kitasatospora sp. NA04385]
MVPIGEPDLPERSPGEPDALAQEVTEELARIAAEVEVEEKGGSRGGPTRRMGTLARRLGHSLGRSLGRSGRRLGAGSRGGLRMLTERLLDAAPRIPVRDLATLRSQHPGARTPEDLADLLVAGSARASTAVGAGAGTVAMMPVPLAMPVELASELLASAAIELKLIAELYAVYGQVPAGSARQRSYAYLAVWSEGRGLDLTRPGALLALNRSAALRRQVSKRLTRSGLRRLPTLAPLLAGAVIGARVCRKDTLRLAAAVREDLRGRQAADPGYWGSPTA